MFGNWSQIVRIGSVTLHDAILYTKRNGFQDGKCRMGGRFGEVFNDFIDKWHLFGIGCTIIDESKSGTFNETTQLYDGLLGQLQKANIDLMAMPVYYPMTNPVMNVIHSPTFFEDTMQICSMYKIPNTSHSGDLLDMFTMVPAGLWYGYLLSYLIFAFLSIVGCKLLGEQLAPLWNTTCAFMDQDNYPTGSRFLTIQSIIVMVGMFFMMTYAGNLMSTDLVTMDSPITVTSYDDIIERNITAVFADQMPAKEMFRISPMDSKEYKISKNTRSIRFDMDWVIDFAMDMQNQKSVTIGRPVIAGVAGPLLTNLEGYNKESQRIYVGNDPNAKKYANTFLMHSSTEGTLGERLVFKMIRRKDEVGLANHIYGLCGAEMAADVLKSEIVQSKLLTITYGHVDEASTDVVAINYAHVHRVMVMVIAGLGIAFLALILELCHSKVSQEWRATNRQVKRITNVRQVKIRRTIKSAKM